MPTDVINEAKEAVAETVEAVKEPRKKKISKKTVAFIAGGVLVVGTIVGIVIGKGKSVIPAEAAEKAAEAVVGAVA